MIDDTLDQRNRQYGSFEANAEIAQELKSLFRSRTAWDTLESDQKEALDNITIKISRILSPMSDQTYADNWVDIAGYATLVAERLKRG